MEVRVDHGAVRVGEVDTVIDEARFKVFQVDLDTKYATILATAVEDDRVKVFLWRDERTIRCDPDKMDIPTGIEFLLPEQERGDDWHVVTEIARYTARVVLFRWPERDTPGT